MDTYANFLARLRSELRVLPDKPEETAESTLRALWFTAAESPRSAQQAMQGELPRLDPQTQRALESLIELRLTGVPLSHLTGRQHFMGMEMLAGRAALIPRRETELLARRATELALGMQTERLLVVDACTGCGNVALAIAQAVPRARVTGTDISSEAIELAKRNAKHLALDERATFVVGDLLASLQSKQYLGLVDVMTCNPPYIRSAKLPTMPAEISAYEPSLAFDGGPLGIGILMRLVNDAPRFLRAGGALVFEVGAGQGAALIKRLEGLPDFEAVESVNDGGGVTRAISARRTRAR